MAAITTAVIAAAGVGLTAYGGMQQSKIAKQQAGVSQQQFAEQQKQDEMRRQAMELDARRKTLETVRNQQRARSAALAAASNQGAAAGSGLQGGYGQISGATNTGLLGISQNLELGNQMFDSNSFMSTLQQRNAALGGQMATAKGWSSLGGSIFQASGQIGALSKGIGNPGSIGGGAVWAGAEGANPWSRNTAPSWSAIG